MTDDRKRPSEENASPLLSEEELKREIADSAFDWDYWLDSQRNVLYVSRSCEQLTGYRREEFLSDPDLVDRIVHPDDRTHFGLHVEQTHGPERKEAAEIEFRIIARDGGEHWINHRCVGIDATDGRYLGRRVSNVNVSRYRRAEENLLRQNRELLATRECARSALRAKDEKRLFADICRILCNVTGYRMAWIGTVEHDEAKTVRPVVWGGVEDGYLASAAITWADTERGRGPTGTAARTGESQVIQNYASDALGGPWRERAYQRGYRSSAAVPVFDSGGGVHAVLTVYGAQPHLFGSGTVRLLEAISGDLSIGIGALGA